MLIVFSGFNFQSQKPGPVKWVTVSGCSLKVDGSTNVNNFSCAIANYMQADTILVSMTGNQPIQLNGSIRLDVQNFDCHNPIMTADLRKTLKVKEFPKVMIKFISLRNYPDASTDVSKGMVVIELAGRTKQFEVDYKVVAAEKNYIKLVGTRRINFTDFNITPPKKLGGMIRTNNELNVMFTLRMKVLY